MLACSHFCHYGRRGLGGHRRALPRRSATMRCNDRGGGRRLSRIDRYCDYSPRRRPGLAFPSTHDWRRGRVTVPRGGQAVNHHHVPRGGQAVNQARLFAARPNPRCEFNQATPRRIQLVNLILDTIQLGTQLGTMTADDVGCGFECVPQVPLRVRGPRCQKRRQRHPCNANSPPHFFRWTNWSEVHPGPNAHPAGAR